MTNNPCIQFDHVGYHYGSIYALRDASFEVPFKSLTAMVGPNGGGKSTTIKLLSGILIPDEGRIHMDKVKTLGYVSQDIGFDTAFPITVGEMVLTGTLNHIIKPFYRYTTEQRDRAAEAIKRVGLQGLEERGIHQLSGGQMRRAIIARALSANADILVLDEPDGSLDIDATKELYAILTSLKADKTIIVASHHIDLVLDIADRALYVNETVTAYEEPQNLKQQLKQGITL